MWMPCKVISASCRHDSNIPHMLTVGVTSDNVTNIKAVATIDPPPKIVSTDSSQMNFSGMTWG